MNFASLKLTKEFTGNILFIGFGCVGKCVMPVLLKEVGLDRKKITVIDKEDKAKEVKKHGVAFVQLLIEEDNLEDTLARFVASGDLIIDLAYNIDTVAMMKWCYDNGVMLINTSVEEWDPYDGMESETAEEKSLYHRQYKINELVTKWKTYGPTMIVDHGANPGLISHLTKYGLVDIASRYMRDPEVPEKKKKEIADCIHKLEFQRLPYLLDVKVIHCSERDTQITRNPKKAGEFLNTWSCEGFFEEGTCGAELGWGTHEDEIPENAVVPTYGNKNQIFLNQMGINTYVRSMVPSGQIRGMVVRHGEAFSMSEYFTVWNDNGVLVYRPTVHYAYQPSDSAIASLWEINGDDYEEPEKMRIMYDDEIISGEDILGALIMGHKYNSWWCGSILSIDEARKLVPGNNATSVQVAAPLVAAIKWMIAHPKAGFNLPDALPFEYVIDFCKPYLGQFVSQSYDWTPVQKQTIMFKDSNHEGVPLDKEENIWRFQNFMEKS